jgi:leucyl-tRNA synthetase
VDFIVIKFVNDEGLIFPCATLRPETVFGATNLWLKPVNYVIVSVNGEKWVVSSEAFEKLKYTDREVYAIGEVKADNFFGKTVKNPVTGKEIPILPAEFVDTDNATGVVMSVPAHAPFDFIAIEDLKRSGELKKYGVDELEPIVLITTDGQECSPAEDIIRKLGIRTQKDAEELEKATKLLYKKEFHKGRLLNITGKYAGMSVQRIKDKLQNDLIEKGIAEVFYEFSEKPVVCRCGTKCVVKVVRDQWFLNYSNPEWKKNVLNWLDEMKIIPAYYKEEFRNKIEWLKDKACARRKGLGTRIPWDKEWLIESLSDSTIYMSYYILAKYINDGTLKAENMTKELLDYIFLGIGKPDRIASSSKLDVDVVEIIRRDFVYWYPVDVRSSGKDLVANHLLFFLFHHVAIFPKKLYPRAIAVNGYVSLEGQKMSKSKGPLLTMKRAVRDYGADVTRMYILYASEYDSDADWRKKDVEGLVSNLKRFYNLAKEYYQRDVEDIYTLDRWLLSKFQRAVKETREAMDNLQTRRAVNTAFFEVMNDVRWYLRRGGKNLSIILDDWVKLLAPFAPHICEEIWHWNHDSFVSLEKFPEYDESKVDFLAEQSEEYIANLVEDMREILKFVDAKEVYLYPAEEWKSEILEIAVNSEDVKDAMRKIMSDVKFKQMGKEVSVFVKKAFREKKDRRMVKFDEKEVIESSREFLENELGVKIILDREKIPEEKIKAAMPGKPAIYAV